MRDFRFQVAVCRFLLAVALVVGLSVSASAQTPAPQSTPAQIEGFVPMSEAAPREILPATPLVFYAYAFVWVALIAYVFSIWRRMARVEQDLASVERRLADGGSRR